MDIQFPITAEAVLNVAGLAIVVAIACTVAKQWLKDWRWLNLVALAFGLGVATLATLVIAEGRPTPAQWFEAGCIGLFGSAVATLGYESITNVLGLLGFGKRAANGLVNKALRAQK